MADTSNSPDISFGSSVSRSVANNWFYLVMCKRFSKMGAAKDSKL